MKKIKIVNIVGARPNFIKIAPLYRIYKKHKAIKPILIHTGQHYNQEMSDDFFKSLKIPKPDYNLKIGSASHAIQTARIMEKLEKALLKEKPDLALVVGDVNSTLAGALTATKLGIKVAHVEAGLRSFDMSMPEEINRRLTDHVSDFLFVTEKSGLINLRKENINNKKVYFVGNVMIDNLINSKKQIASSGIIKRLNLRPRKFVLVTMHRPNNVDNKQNLQQLAEILKKISEYYTIIFPAHPRTRKNIRKFKLDKSFKSITGLKIIKPLDYFNLIKLIKESFCVITDSGGIQEESAFLKIPVLTIRKTTERPATINCGSNTLVNLDKNEIFKKIEKLKNFDRNKIKKLPLNDGQTSQRIVKIILNYYGL